MGGPLLLTNRGRATAIRVAQVAAAAAGAIGRIGYTAKPEGETEQPEPAVNEPGEAISQDSKYVEGAADEAAAAVAVAGTCTIAGAGQTGDTGTAEKRDPGPDRAG